MKFEIVQIDPQELERFENIKREFDITKITVEDDSQFRNLAELLKKVKGKEKEIKSVFKEPKARAYKNHRQITTMEKEYLDYIKRFEEKGKQAIGEYMLKKEEQNTALNPVDIPKVKGVSARDVYKWEVEDASKVPWEIGNLCLWQINEKVIDDLVKTSNGTIRIPGIKITKEKSVSVRNE